MKASAAARKSGLSADTPGKETRLVTLYRLRAEQAEYKAKTWEKMVQVLMEQNQEHAATFDQIRHDYLENSRELDRSMAAVNQFIEKAEGVLRRALAVIEGSTLEDKTEVREAIAKLLSPTTKT